MKKPVPNPNYGMWNLDSVDLVTLIIWIVSSTFIFAIYGLDSSLLSTGKTREIFGVNQTSDLSGKKQRLTLRKYDRLQFQLL